jgi:PAS domain S-box-containing protein
LPARAKFRPRLHGPTRAGVIKLPGCSADTQAMSDAMILQSAATFALSAALAVYVALQGVRTPLHSVVLALLFAFMAWTGGVVVIFGSGFDPLLSRLGALVLYAGVMCAAPLWLFLCARVAGATVALERPRAVLLAVFTPSVLNFAAVATDPLHGLFAHGLVVEQFTEAVTVWAGPFFWVHTGWSYVCTVGGIALCLRAARRRPGTVERRRYVLVAMAAAVPLLSFLVTLFAPIPGDVRLTPADLGVSAILIVTAILRYRFLEANLVPASEVISHLREALVLADAAGVVVDVNPAAERLLRRSNDELRGRPLDEVIRDLAPQSRLDDWEKTPAGEGTSVRTAITPDERVLDMSHARVFEADRPVGSFLVIRDRTEQHQAERARHQSQRLESLGVLVAGIAHEINNPLAFVRTNLSHLTGLANRVEKKLDAFDPPDAAALSEMSEVILETQGGVDRISRIVNATRRLSRAPRRGREPVDLNEIVLEALQIANFHSNRTVEVSTDLDAASPRVCGSSEQLGQVLLNLLINAKQATGGNAEGRIHVETRLVGDVAFIRVHDNGPGVDPADRESIFDPFFTTKGPDEGTGLGLAIAFDIATDHDGDLEVGTSHLGGACFTLQLQAVTS